jgi:cysteinyl-tRNA synthetase
LVFPHHENELAQSRGAGNGFAQYWMHNAWVTLSGEKMSKSLGNVVSIEEMLRKVRAVELRYYLVGPHYRSMIEYSDAALAESVSAYRRIESFLGRVSQRVGVVPSDGVYCADFTVAMDNDFGTPLALAAIHGTVHEGNAALEGGNHVAAIAAASSVRAMTGILGVDPLSPQWASNSTTETTQRQALTVLVDQLLEQRQLAKRERDFATADAVRNQLAKAGIAVEDTPDGPQWTLKDS